jgi:hypothetical protein
VPTTIWGPLPAALDRPQHRVQGADGLATPHFSHQQPLHRLRTGEVGVDLIDRRSLIAGELEREGFEPCQNQFPAGGRELDPPPGGEPSPATGDQRRLVEEELLEGEPLAGRLGRVLVAWEVGGGQGILGIWK